MSANVSTNLLGLLLATCLASGASALEVGQTQAPAGDTPSFGLPAFLDGARLPDLQEAWRAHFGQAQETPEAPAAAEPASTPAVEPEPVAHETPAASPDPASDAAIESARAALTRAEQASDKAASVRTRAEELSRRFGAGDAAATPPAAAEAPAVEGSDSTTTDAIAAPADGGGSTATGQAAVDQPAAPVETTAKADATPSGEASSDENSNASPRTLMRAGLSPPAARPSATAAPRKPVMAPARSAGGPSAEPKATTGADPIPDNFRAFGWNSQP